MLRIFKRFTEPTYYEYLRKEEDQEGFIAKFLSKEKGHGVFATKNFEAGEFLLEYRGKLILEKSAETHELHAIMYSILRMEIQNTGEKRICML